MLSNLSVCVGVGGWECPSSSSIICIGTASFALMNSAPSSASTVLDMTALIIWDALSTVPLLVGAPCLLIKINAPLYAASHLCFE